MLIILIIYIGTDQREMNYKRFAFFCHLKKKKKTTIFKAMNDYMHGIL